MRFFFPLSVFLLTFFEDSFITYIFFSILHHFVGWYTKHHIDGFVQDSGISNANALKIPQSCAKPLS